MLFKGAGLTLALSLRDESDSGLSKPPKHAANRTTKHVQCLWLMQMLLRCWTGVLLVVRATLQRAKVSSICQPRSHRCAVRIFRRECSRALLAYAAVSVCFAAE